MGKIFFIAGIHGVGKTFLCNQIVDKFNFKTYSASKLIEEFKQEKFDNNKKIKDINNNQEYLIRAINRIRSKKDIFVLDGHFCLLNSESQVTRIPEDTFLKISPNAILVLHDTVNNIIKRLQNRDHVTYDVDLIDTFQKEELKYSLEIAEILQVPYLRYKNTEDINKVWNFLLHSLKLDRYYKN